MTELPVDVPGERAGSGPGIHSLDAFVLEVPDLEVARNFYTRFGLDVTDEGEGLALRTFGQGHVWGRVVEGSRKQTHHLSLGIYEADLAGFERKFEEREIRRIDAPRGWDSDGIWFRGFDETVMELRVTGKSSPDFKSPGHSSDAGREPRGTRLGHASLTPVRPERLSHCLFFSPDVPAATAFCRDILGMQLSDRCGDVLAFLHGAHGSDHHMIAFAKSSGPGFHHPSWQVGSMEEVGRGAMLMADAGFDKGWGLGRHVIGSNYFHYVQDPWGGFCEYSFDIDYVPREHVWDTKDFPPVDALAIWGPEAPSDFVHNYEAD
ncbi:VOC family protein [Sphingopyxis sp.]|uniref:VOC family protein n=1 Tax=Sphingopyxis sp. TaxID=1908224 RepID=UPI002D7826E0|nr:VOC family protein [Sphingopyxis sp.]HET6526359.1 VOC family protein [Sphingopyxis sp.]